MDDQGDSFYIIFETPAGDATFSLPDAAAEELHAFLSRRLPLRHGISR